MTLLEHQLTVMEEVPGSILACQAGTDLVFQALNSGESCMHNKGHLAMSSSPVFAVCIRFHNLTNAWSLHDTAAKVRRACLPV